MAKYIASEGEDFEIEWVSRAYNARRVTAFKVNGTTGVVSCDNLVVTQGIALTGDITVDDLTVGDDLAVTGDAAITGLATIGGTLAVTGAVTLTSTLAANGHITIADAKNIVVNTSTGTKIGTGTTQKIGFWNATPVGQYATTGTLTGFTAGSGTASKDDSTFTGNTGTAAYTVGDVVKALKLAGIMASS